VSQSILAKKQTWLTKPQYHPAIVQNEEECTIEPTMRRVGDKWARKAAFPIGISSDLADEE
jgi:hypothetical protein